MTNGKKATIEKKTQAIPPEVQEEKPILDFEESPMPVSEQGPVANAFSSLKTMLGMKDEPEKEKKTAPVIGAKLSKKQQLFVDATAPTLTLAIISLATYLWGRVDPDYGVLAPSEEVAFRICEPLIRIYARHNNFLIDMHPDMVDTLMSLSALAGYLHVSLKLVQEIKKEKQTYEQGYAQENVSSITGTANASSSKNGTGNNGNRPASLFGRGRENAQPASGNGRTTENVGRDDIPDQQREAHEALLRLSQLDYEHRARRNGTA